jgi:transcriptional regulator with XRE-family HTH domain
MDEQLPKPNDLLRQTRKEKNLTQHQLAEILNVSLDSVRSWERGRRSSPHPETMERLCTFFQKTPLELGFGATEEIADSLSPTKTPVFVSHDDINRSRIIKRVRATWIDGVLQESLHKEALIALGLQKQPDALGNPWSFAVQETNLPPKQLPLGTTIVEVYDAADGDLLVLGEAGGGKTTLLLELTRTLLTRADQNETEPIPVVFNLSSWAVKQASLTDWLTEELMIKYHVPRITAQRWIQNDQLILLLDGLDEVAHVALAACVKAINVYKQQHPNVHVVVCCRLVEYFTIETRVKLEQAVLIQPLTMKQIHQYLSVGGQFENIKDALEEDLDLRELAKSPLMLSILMLTYSGGAKTSESFVLTGSFEKRRQLVLDRYAQHMLTRRAETSYTEADTQRWLIWLARRMQQRSLTEFFVERMQPDWIAPGSPSDRYRTVALRFINGIEVVVLAALFALVRGGKVGGTFGVGAGLLGKLGAGKGNVIFGWMSPGVGGGVEAGGSLGVIFALIFSLQILLMSTSAFPVISWKSIWHGLKRGLKNGLITLVVVIIFCVPIFSIIGGLTHGLKYGSGTGLFAGLLVGLLSGLLAGLRYEPMGSQLSQGQDRSLGARLGDGLILGLFAGLSFALVDIALHIVLQSVIAYALIAGFFFFCIYGFAGGGRLIPLGTIQPAESVSWSWGEIRRTFPETLTRGLIGSLCITFCVAVVIALGGGMFYGFGYGVRYGLVYGLIVGLVTCLTGVLASLLHSGWSSDLLNENQLFRPNEGIRRSFTNAVLAGILSAPVGGVLSGIACAIAFGVIGGLSGWLILGIGFALVFGLLIGFQFAMIHGGTACIEHYLLRWQLWRSGAIPANYIAFLDYAASRILLRKVGGGYIFAHRILLDYFASLPGEDR